MTSDIFSTEDSATVPLGKCAFWVSVAPKTATIPSLCVPALGAVPCVGAPIIPPPSTPNVSPENAAPFGLAQNPTTEAMSSGETLGVDGGGIMGAPTQGTAPKAG